MNAIDTFKNAGFEIELGGGGCEFLSRYAENGAYVWITAAGDGVGMPSDDDWLIGFYPANWDGDEIDFIRSSDSGADLLESLAGAIARLDPSEETLGGEYQEYLRVEGLGQFSAEEMLHEQITDRQRAWISDFLIRWEAMETNMTPEEFRAAMKRSEAIEEGHGPHGFTAADER